MSMLLAEANFFEKYGLLIILVVLLIAMFVYNFFRQKKFQQQEEQMAQNLKVGTKVKTYAGIYGTIVGMYNSTDGKIAILSLDGKTTMEVDFRSIYAIDEKTEVTDQPVVEEVEQPNEAKEQEKEEVIKVDEVAKPAKKSKKDDKKTQE